MPGDDDAVSRAIADGEIKAALLILDWRYRGLKDDVDEMKDAMNATQTNSARAADKRWDRVISVLAPIFAVIATYFLTHH